MTLIAFAGEDENHFRVVTSGFGITILPRWSVERDVEAGDLVARRLKVGARPCRPLRWVAAVRRGATQPFLHEFLDQIRAQAAGRRQAVPLAG